jgi:TIR domain-containing protein
MADLITLFISYAHEDVELARAIQARLEAEGFKVWIDEGALRAGDSLIQSIATAIHEMEFVVALITEASVDSRWCQHEIRLAMTSGLNREGVKVLPVRVGEVPIPGELEDTVCGQLDPSDLDRSVERLAADARSHHEDRQRAKDAGEPLPTSGAMPAVSGGTAVFAPTFVQGPPPVPKYEPVRIIGIVKEGVGQPRNDGSRGSALYKVPLRLSRTPSPTWAELFVRCWDSPPSWTTMHRPGIARVSGDTIVLDGTTMEELESVHMKTLKLCVKTVNEQEEAHLERVRAKKEQEDAARREHQREIDEIAQRLKFDDEDPESPPKG